MNCLLGIEFAVSLAANIIAIITFLFFLLGGILTGIQNIKQAKRNRFDCFVWVNDNSKQKKFDFCHTADLCYDLEYVEKLLIYSSERMYDFKIMPFKEYHNKDHSFLAKGTNEK